MNVPAQLDFFCPGETHAISRALHFARLAEFYPACRNCPRREETGILSEKLVKRLREVWTDNQESAGFEEAGYSGNSPSDLTPGMARQAAAAFGLWLRRTNLESNEFRVALANDGRPIMPDFIAATSEGLRWASCEVFDISKATSAAVEFAIGHFHLVGGILLGGDEGKSSSICLKFWSPGPRRLLGKLAFEPLEAILRCGLDRPERSFGSLHQLQTETPYLASLAGEFHGLRPLRIVVDSTSRPWFADFEKLLQTTACRILPRRVLPLEFARQIIDDRAHLGICVSNDGESCTFFDERGQLLDDAKIANALEKATLDASGAPRDALAKIARLLRTLSRDDRPCSAVLDSAAQAN